MDLTTADELIALNRQFYEEFGGSFAQTRKRIQPGVRKILNTVISDGIWLDMGCGSGNFAAAWKEALFDGNYIGVDFSSELLKEAVAMTAVNGVLPQSIRYLQADLTGNDWVNVFRDQPFDGIVSFAALHHIPMHTNRRQFFLNAASLLKSGKPFVVSVWQPQNSEKLLGRIVPWSVLGINEAELDPRDVLLDWRAEENDAPDRKGFRYVHLFSREELHALAAETGFSIVDEFFSDGREGNLALYLVMRKR